VIVGSDDDAVNLQGVLAVRRCWPDCKAFVRFQHHSVFVEKLAERHRFAVLGVDDMLTLALCQHTKCGSPRSGDWSGLVGRGPRETNGEPMSPSSGIIPAHADHVSREVYDGFSRRNVVAEGTLTPARGVSSTACLASATMRHPVVSTWEEIRSPRGFSEGALVRRRQLAVVVLNGARSRRRRSSRSVHRPSNRLAQASMDRVM